MASRLKSVKSRSLELSDRVCLFSVRRCYDTNRNIDPTSKSMKILLKALGTQISDILLPSCLSIDVYDGKVSIKLRQNIEQTKAKSFT